VKQDTLSMQQQGNFAVIHEVIDYINANCTVCDIHCTQLYMSKAKIKLQGYDKVQRKTEEI